ncbi:xanthine/uracil permease family protein [Tieghemostelium lacteum]|uniref:Xanthine/uracil permease family protein n=1 Tax=Tieghemostelium lacteum TaxID=361077 RepID=A0A152A0V5_TIELA|nr:xanthine/uracil permease family protein [Tieghemostelium lacteum]|eukprot:KYQ99700.1 xanthine/uracil permease family protein [Tieghemostelium lacteum]
MTRCTLANSYQNFLRLCGVIWKLVVNYFPKYTLNPQSDPQSVVGPTERLPISSTTGIALQHVLAMFGSTVVGPLLMGFSPNTALLFSGIGTLIFYVCTGGKVPSYVGSSFAFIGVVNSATGFVYVPGGPGNQHIGLASGGILICGVCYLAIAIVVMLVGSRWLEVLMPPVVTGAVVITIGLSLSGSAIIQASTTGFDAWMALLTVVIVCLVTTYAPGPLRRLPVLIGGLTSYLVYLFFGLGGIGPGIDFSLLSNSKWIGIPPTARPVFDGSAITLIAPVAIILAAENIGHIKAVGAMTESSLDKFLGRAFLGDSLATILAASFGSIGTTTYAENIGVMSITRIFSTLTFVIAAFVAIILGILPIFGAFIQTIPPGVFGGLSVVLFGIVGITGIRMWIGNQIDFQKSRNLLTAGVTIVVGIGMAGGHVVQWGVVKFDGIGCATLTAIVLYQLLRDDWGEMLTKLWNKITKKNTTSDKISTNDTITPNPFDDNTSIEPLEVPSTIVGDENNQNSSSVVCLETHF